MKRKRLEQELDRTVKDLDGITKIMQEIVASFLEIRDLLQLKRWMLRRDLFLKDKAKGK